MRRQFALAMALALSIGSATLLAQDQNRRDGNWWIEQAANVKLTYMVGFFDGMDLGNNFSVWKFINGNESARACFNLVADSYETYQGKFFSHLTNGQLTAGLDEFYSDYRNRRLLVSNGVWLVVNSIAGTPKDELEKLVENWRRNVK